MSGPVTQSQRRQTRAEEYGRLALAATALVESSVLDHVREKHERAAAKWRALAALDERAVEDAKQPRSVTPGPPAGEA